MIASTLLHELHERVSDSIGVKETDGGGIAVDIPLAFPDGDQCRVLATKNPNGTWTIKDGGAAVMRASYPNGIDVMGKRYVARFQQITQFYGLSEIGGELVAADKPDVGGAVFSVVQASMEIVNLVRLQNEPSARKSAKFETDLARLVKTAFHGQVDRHWNDPQNDPEALYPVKYRVQRPGSRQLFIFGVNTALACANSTISCMFHKREKTDFVSVAICRDEEELPKKETARLRSQVDRWFGSIQNKPAIVDFLRQAG